jgi:hypothetical protein
VCFGGLQRIRRSCEPLIQLMQRVRSARDLADCRAGGLNLTVLRLTNGLRRRELIVGCTRAVRCGTGLGELARDLVLSLGAKVE